MPRLQTIVSSTPFEVSGFIEDYSPQYRVDVIVSSLSAAYVNFYLQT